MQFCLSQMEGDRGVQCACRAFLWSGPTISGGAQVTSLDSAQLVVTARVGRWCLIWLLVNVWLLMLKLVVGARLVVGAQFSFWS